MRAILLLAMNDLRRTVRDRASFFWMLALPVMMMWVFSGVGYSANTPKVALTVVDKDGGWLARAFVEDLRGDRVELKEMTADAWGREENKPRTLVLPEGFTRGVLEGKQQKLRIEEGEGSNQDFSRAAEVLVLRAVARALGRLAEMSAAVSLDAAGDAARAAGAFRALRERARLVGLDVTTAGKGTAVPSGRAQSVPGILTMFVLMSTVIYGGVFLTIEKREGMLRRQVTLPMTRAQLLLGKVAGRLLLAAMQIVILLVVGRFVFGVTYGTSPAGLAVLLGSYAFCVAGLSTLLGAIFSTPEQAGAIGWLASMVLAAMGGCWWPAEVMPEWLQKWAHLLPTAWAMDGFHALISFGRGLDAVVLPSLALVGFAALFTALGARRLRTSIG